MSISSDTMHRLSVTINSSTVRVGQRAGKEESQWNSKKNMHCRIFFCGIVQLCSTDLLKSMFALPSITCWKPPGLAGTCHCLYSTEIWIKSVSLLICMPSQQCTHCKCLSKRIVPTWREGIIFALLPTLSNSSYSVRLYGDIYLSIGKNLVSYSPSLIINFEVCEGCITSFPFHT